MANDDPQLANQSQLHDQFGSPNEIFDITLVFKIPNQDKVFLREDFCPHVSQILLMEEVVALGTTGRNDLWHLVVTSLEETQKLLIAGDFYVDANLVTVSSLGDVHFQARIHWLPLYIPMGLVLDALERSATVVSSHFERTRQGPWTNTATMVRSVLLKCNMDQVPHLLNIPFQNGVFSALVTITGRKSQVQGCWTFPEKMCCAQVSPLRNFQSLHRGLSKTKYSNRICQSGCRPQEGLGGE